MPSVVVVPVIVSADVPVEVTLMVCTNVSDLVSSNKDTAAALVPRVVEPSPSRTMSRSPAVKAAPDACPTQVADVSTQVRIYRFNKDILVVPRFLGPVA